MNFFKISRVWLAMLLSGCSLLVHGANAQQIDVKLFSSMQWRLIGPFRAGRVTAVAGVPGEPAVYYMGTPGGGIWKTTDGGRVWTPIFDHEHVASIGALAVAPSDPKILYAGTGEQTAGNGVYKSTDSGATWTNMGLRATHYIQAVLVDPRNPNVVFARCDRRSVSRTGARSIQIDGRRQHLEESPIQGRYDWRSRPLL